MNTTEIGILGPLRSKIEGNEVVLPGTKLRSIMAILAFRAGETVISDVLVEELGLDQSSTNAANTLQAHVSRLRRWLCMHNSAPNLLETTNSGYRLNLDRTQVDAHLFVDQAEQAPRQQVVGRIVAALAASGWAADDEGRLREFVQSAS